MEGLRKVCHTIRIGPRPGRTVTWCVDWPQWPPVVLSAYPKHPGPDPGPFTVRIDGVDSEFFNQLFVLDAVEVFAGRLTPELKQPLLDAARLGVERIKQQLPEGISLEE